MYISEYQRADSRSLPGLFLSSVGISPGDGDGYSIAEVSNTLQGDRDSIDAVMFYGTDGDILGLEGVHSLIRSVRPHRTRSAVLTDGTDPVALDDLAGAGYANWVILRVDGALSASQSDCVRIARDAGCRLFAVITMDPLRIDAETLKEIGGALRGSDMIVLRRCGTDSDRRYRKNEMVTLARSLRGMARDVKIV